MDILFKIKCIKTRDRRFTLDKIYNMYYKTIKGDRNYIRVIPEGYVDLLDFYIHIKDDMSPEEIFKLWYDDCMWHDYDFVYVNANEYLVDLL